jgi:hypothetical protein
MSGATTIRWGRIAASLVTTAAFMGGAVLLADWLREREELAAPLSVAQTPPLKAVEPDVRMRPYLPDGVAFGPVRPVAWGAQRGVFAAGASTEGPEDVFARVVAALNPGHGPEAVRATLRQGPSLSGALRMQVTVGVLPGSAFLVRLPLDVEATARGDVALEPGGVMLAFPTSYGWDYVSFFFPDGLDLRAWGEESMRVPKDPLAPLGTDVAAMFEPQLELPSAGVEGEGSGAAVLCRAKGVAGEAVERAGRTLEGRGYRRLYATADDRAESTWVLERRDTQVWMSAPDRMQKGGLVTVWMRTP